MSYLLNDEGKETLKQFLNKVSKTQTPLGKYIAEIETDANYRLDMGKEVFFVLTPSRYKEEFRYSVLYFKDHHFTKI